MREEERERERERAVKYQSEIAYNECAIMVYQHDVPWVTWNMSCRRNNDCVSDFALYNMNKKVYSNQPHM